VYIHSPAAGRTRTLAYKYTFRAGRQFVELNVFYCGSGEKEQAKLFESCTGALDTQRENIMNAICPRSRVLGKRRDMNARHWGMRRVQLLQLYKIYIAQDFVSFFYRNKYIILLSGFGKLLVNSLMWEN
jgi:hypothetical protein